MIKNREIGRLLVDAGDVVCFSMDEVSRLAEKLGVSEDGLIARYKGVSCGFAADGNYGVDQLTAINTEGESYPVIMIGGDPEKFHRFLRDDEKDFNEFYKNHPRRAAIGTGKEFNHDLFEEVVQEYRDGLLKG